MSSVLHEKRIAEAEEKLRSLGKTEGYEWVVRTRERLLADGSGQKEVTEDKVVDRILKVGIFKTEPAKVTVQKGLTLNLGSYESARFTVGIELPCYVEEVQELTKVLNDLVEARVKAEVMGIRGSDIRPGYEAKRKEQAGDSSPVGA